MSGGSLGYIYHKIESVIEDIAGDTPLRRAFRSHLCLISKALHDIEWVQSGDYGPGDDAKAMEACLSSGAILEQVIRDAELAKKDLEVVLKKAKKLKLK